MKKIISLLFLCIACSVSILAVEKELTVSTPTGEVYGTLLVPENDPKNIEAIVYSLFVPEIRTQSLPNETCSPTDYIRLNPTKSLVDAYLCTDGKPAKTGLEYYKKC